MEKSELLHANKRKARLLVDASKDQSFDKETCPAGFYMSFLIRQWIGVVVRFVFADVGRVAGESVGLGIDVLLGVVDRHSSFGSRHRNEVQFLGFADDIAAGIETGKAGIHGGIDGDTLIVNLDPVLLQ